MKKLFVLILVMFLIAPGCSTLFQSGKLTPAGQNLADNAIVIAGTFLDVLGQFYPLLLTEKSNPSNTETATVALSMSDNAATTLRYAKAGGNVTDGQLNTAIGQVKGAQALLAKMTK